MNLLPIVTKNQKKRPAFRPAPFFLEEVTQLRPLGIGPNFLGGAAVLNKNQMSYYELK